MNMKMKKVFGILLGLAMMLGLMLGMSLTAYADGAVAKVGDTEYNNFGEALSAWTDGTTLTLLANVETANTISMSSGTKTFALNGHNITKTGDSGSVFQVTSGNLTVNGTGSISGGKGMIGVPDDWNRRGGGFYVSGDAAVTVNNVTITGNQAYYGGGVFLGAQATFTMNNSVISQNHINNYSGWTSGGGVWIQDSGTFEMNGGSVTENTADSQIAGIHAFQDGGNNKGIFKVSGNAIVKNNTRGGSKINVSGMITVAGELTDSANIGVNHDAGVFTNSTITDYNDASKFTSDNENYAVGKYATGDNKGQLFLGSPVTVTFDVKGHGTAPDKQKVASASIVTKPLDPTAEGWTFGGWYKDADCTVAWDFDADTVSQATTIYAKWTAVVAYPLWVGGTQVTSANAANITGTTTATAIYDKESNTLTLDEANITGQGVRAGCIDYEGIDPLTINLVGNNIVGDGSDSTGINTANASLTIKGDGKLNVKVKGEGIYSGNNADEIRIEGGDVTVTVTDGFGIYAYKNVTITGGTVNTTGYGNGGQGFGTTFGVITITGGEVTAAGTNRAINGTLKNSITGTGWTDAEGTTGKTAIEVNTDPGQELTELKKVQFPGLPAAKVTTKPEAKELTFTGSAQELVSEGKADGGTMQYALGENGDTAPESGWIDSIPEGIEAKTYYVWYKAVGNDKHTDSDPEVVSVIIAEPDTYTVTVTNDGHGTGTATPASGVEGTEVTLTSKPNEGYMFKEWQVVSGGVTVAENKFKIGTANVEIKAVFEEIPADVYTVTVTNDGHGTGSATPTSGVEGTEVTLAAAAAEGYQFKEWQVVSGGVTVSENKFKIGTANVEVKAIFEEIPAGVYTVTVTNDGHGIGTATPASGVSGTEVVLAATAAKGYKFKEWQVVSGGVTIAENKFAIGTANVEIKAVFEEIPATVYTFTEGTGAEWTKGTQTGQNFTITGTPDTGIFDKFTGLASDGSAVSPTNYTATSGSVKLTLKAEWLETLAAGKHTLTANFTDGKAETSFTVKDAAPAPTPTPKPKKVPRTGDGAPLGLWIGLIAVGLIGLGTFIAMKRRTQKK